MCVCMAQARGFTRAFVKPLYTESPLAKGFCEDSKAFTKLL